MARKADPNIALRNQKIQADFRANPFQTDLELSERYGVKPARIRQILDEVHLRSSNRRRDPSIEPGVNMLKPRSNMHVILGSELQTAHLEATVSNTTIGGELVSPEQSLRDLAEQLAFSVVTLRRVFLGQENLTLSELQRIAKWMKLPVSSLIATTEKKETQYSVKKLKITGPSAD